MRFVSVAFLSRVIIRSTGQPINNLKSLNVNVVSGGGGASSYPVVFPKLSTCAVMYNFRQSADPVVLSAASVEFRDFVWFGSGSKPKGFKIDVFIIE